MLNHNVAPVWKSIARSATQPLKYRLKCQAFSWVKSQVLYHHYIYSAPGTVVFKKTYLLFQYVCWICLYHVVTWFIVSVATMASPFQKNILSGTWTPNFQEKYQWLQASISRLIKLRFATNTFKFSMLCSTMILRLDLTMLNQITISSKSSFIHSTLCPTWIRNAKVRTSLWKNIAWFTLKTGEDFLDDE